MSTTIPTARRRRANRTGRLLLATVVLTFGVLIGAAVVAYLAYQQATSQLLLERGRELAYFSANRLAIELAKLAEPLDDLARTEVMSGGSFYDQRQALESSRQRLAVYDVGVVLIDRRGIVVGTEPWRPEILGRDWSDRHFFSHLLSDSSAYFSDAVEDGPDGQPVIVVSVPVQGGRGEFVGALAGMFRLGESNVSSFYASIVRLRLPQTGNAYLIDGNGRLLYATQSSAIGGTFERIGLPVKLAGSAAASRARNTQGHDLVIASAPVPTTRWTLLLEDNWGVVTAPSRRYAGIMIGLIGAGMMLPTLAAVYLRRQRSVQVLEHERADQDMRLSQMMHAALLPKFTPAIPGWMVASYHQSAEGQCGCLYDFLLTPDGGLMLAMGEMNLTSAATSMAMAIARSSLRSAVRARLSPAEALIQANAALFPELPPEGCFACVCAVLDPTTGRLEFASAGFAPPSILGTLDGGPTTASSPLGRDLAARYQVEAVDIPPGGQVVLVGRGLAGINTPDGNPLSVEMLHEVLKRLPEDCDDPPVSFANELRERLGYPSHLEIALTIVALRRRLPA